MPGVYNFTRIELSILNMGNGNAIPEYTVPFRIRRKKFREFFSQALQEVLRTHRLFTPIEFRIS